MTKEALTISERTAILFDEYIKLVGEFFPGVISTDEFVAAFGTIFLEYQHSRRLQMSPQSIKERKITCNSAAALMGVWYGLLSTLEPSYFIEDPDPLQNVSKSCAHSLIGLPLTPGPLTIYHYTTPTNLIEKKQPTLYPTVHIQGTREFLFNRVASLGISTTRLRAT